MGVSLSHEKYVIETSQAIEQEKDYLIKVSW